MLNKFEGTTNTQNSHTWRKNGYVPPLATNLARKFSIDLSEIVITRVHVLIGGEIFYSTAWVNVSKSVAVILKIHS